MNTHPMPRSELKRALNLIAPWIVFILLLSSCNLPGTTALPTSENANWIPTAAAQTVEAQLTLAPFQTAVVQLTQISQATPTLMAPTEPPEQMEATATVLPPTQQPTATFTLGPVVTKAPTATPILPTSTVPAVPCDRAGFVTDVTVNDGTTITANSKFTKTWRLKNTGTCTWTADYAIVFVSGDQMDAPNDKKIGTSVKSNETVDISVDLVAPSATGKYTGNWKLRNASGVLFGIGDKADKNFWVKIQVGEASSFYDFVKNYCSAEWRNGSAALSCPGTEGDSNGFVVKKDNAKWETGQVEDESGILTYPQNIENGTITGKYPGLDIKTGDHFRAVIGCLDGYSNCNVMFSLNYQVEGGAIQNLGSWTQTYDKSLKSLDVDLSSLNGKKVVIILKVEANGSPSDDGAFWLAPRVTR